MMLTRRQAVSAVLAATAIVAGTVCWLVFRTTPEKEVRRTVQDIALVIESRRFTELDRYIGATYRGEICSSRDEILQRVAAAADEAQDLKIAVASVEVDAEQDRARSIVLYNVTGTVYVRELSQRVQFSGLMQEKPGRPEAIYVEWLRDGQGQWQVDYLTWKVQPHLAHFPRTVARLAK